MKLAREIKGGRVHDPIGPMSEAIKNKETGVLRSSTIDLGLAREEIKDINKPDPYAAICLDHYPSHSQYTCQ